MTSSGDSDDASYSKRKVAYVFSPEYIQTCDSLSKVPNRVSWNRDNWFSQILFIAKSAFYVQKKIVSVSCLMVSTLLFYRRVWSTHL